MLNQRLLATFLAVTTVTTTITVNVSASYANNSANVQYLAQTTWQEGLQYAIDFVNIGVEVYKNRTAPQEALNTIDNLIQQIKESNDKRQIDRLRNELKNELRNFPDNNMQQKLRDLRQNSLRRL